MTNKNSREIILKRKLAIIELLECSRNWQNELYIDTDFTIDTLIRKHTNKEPKEVGKPPYDYIEI